MTAHTAHRRHVLEGFGAAAAAACGPARGAEPLRTRAAQLQVELDQAVRSGAVPGALLLLARGGRTEFLGVAGVADAQSQAPLRPDTVFWLASMSKPITSVAVLLLAEAGKVGLDDPVSRFAPEFATLKVRTSDGGLVDLTRPVTVRDLLTHTSGIVTAAGGPALPPFAPDETLARWIAKLGATPLDHQPGEAWAYSNAAGFDVLGRIVEVASGLPFDAFLQDRIFAPLGMTDTGFGSRTDLEGRRARLSGPLASDPHITGLTYKSGSAGLWSTAEDYRRFAEMLGNRGTHRGRPFLKPATVSLMASDQVRGLYPGLTGRADTRRGMGFGLGVAVITDGAAAGLSLPNGSFGWDGAGGGRFWSIPAWRGAVVMLAPSQPVQMKLEAAVAQVATAQGQGTHQ